MPNPSAVNNAGLSDFGRMREASEPAYDAVAVTPSDSTNLTVNARALYIGVTGDVTLVTINGNAVLFKAVAVGILPVGCSRVNNTATTATNIVALY